MNIDLISKDFSLILNKCNCNGDYSCPDFQLHIAHLKILCLKYAINDPNLIEIINKIEV